MIDTLDRVRAVPDHVAETVYLFAALLFDVGQDRFEGLEITVNV